MSLITLPVGILQVSWTTPERANYIVRSEYSAAATIVDRGTYRRGFQASVTLAARSDDDVRAWRRFFMQASILSNSFELPAVRPSEQAAITPETVTARASASAGTTQLPTKGWGRAGVEVVMREGQMISHAGRLHILMGDASSGDGGNNDRALINILPTLGAASIEDTPVYVRNPVATMRLTGVQGGWEQLLAHYEPVGFSAEEVVL